MFSTVVPSVKKEVPQDAYAGPTGDVVFAGVGFVVVISLVFFLRRHQLRRKALRAEVEGESRLAVAAVPCGRCRYFSDNPYLPCAVNPVDVLTAAARDCESFRPLWEEGENRPEV